MLTTTLTIELNNSYFFELPFNEVSNRSQRQCTEEETVEGQNWHIHSIVDSQLVHHRNPSEHQLCDDHGHHWMHSHCHLHFQINYVFQ